MCHRHFFRNVSQNRDCKRIAITVETHFNVHAVSGIHIAIQVYLHEFIYK